MLLTSLALLCCCAVTPPPDAEPDWWVSWGNDFYGVAGIDPDDNRTNEITIGCNIAGVCKITVDDSMLTHLIPGRPRTGERLDELTLLVGAQLFHGVWIGEGWRDRRNLGGESMQNWFHRQAGDRPVDATYESSQDSFLLYCATSHELVGNKSGGVIARTQTVGSTDGTIDCSQAVLALVGHRKWQVWCGPVMEERIGSYRAGVVREVAQFERGLYVETGVSIGNWSFDTRYQLKNNCSIGAVTYSWKL